MSMVSENTEAIIDRIQNPIDADGEMINGDTSTQYALLGPFLHQVKAGAYVHVGDLVRALYRASMLELGDVEPGVAMRTFAEGMRREAKENYGKAAEVEPVGTL
jgi:hypothetical protein